MSFKVIPPLDITDSILISSNIDEPDTGEAEWDSGTTYALGDTIYKADTHIMYESLIESNLANDPADEIQGDIENPPTNWLEVGRTNRWQMFNLLRNNKSEWPSPITFALMPMVRTNSIGLFGLEASSVTVTVTSGVSTVYQNTVDLNNRQVFDYYDYCYAPFLTKPSVALFDLPAITDASISVSIAADSGNVKVGSVAIGNFADIGSVLYGAESDSLNFSRIDRAFDGTSLLRARRTIPKTIQNIFTDKNKTNLLRNLRTNLNAVPAVWAGLDQTDDEYFEALLILGIYKKFTIKLDHPTKTVTELELEEI